MMKTAKAKTTVDKSPLKEKEKVALASCLLLFIPVFVLAFNGFEGRYYFPFLAKSEFSSFVSFNPEVHVSKNFNWVISLGSDRLCAFIYVICAIIRPDFKKCLRVDLWVFYAIFEALRLVDLFLTYEQTPFRAYYGIFLILFTSMYAILYVFKND